ncbi:MAG: manganese catalase family protein [Clostridiales bacterium]|jgi:spore coat protein JC|nr:manganese catalase family protein [Clostridiales bacterium]
MWVYEKKLMYPINIKRADARMAKAVMDQYGGPDGELGASLRYISQHYAMVTPEAKAILIDVATEELGHVEMVATMVRQLTKNLTPDEVKKQGYDAYYVEHGLGVYPQTGSGLPFSALAFASKGDPIADLHEDMAAEQKARATYENIMKVCDDPDVLEPLRFLREREVVHFQRFGEALRIVQDYLDNKKRFYTNPKCCK